MLNLTQQQHGRGLLGFRSSARSWRRRAAVCASSSFSSKAVIFDLGKVLLDFNFSRAAAGLSQLDRSGSVPPEVLLELFGHGSGHAASQPLPSPSLVEQYERGLLSTEEFFEAVAQGSGLRCGLADFSRHYADIFSPIPEMIAQHALLRAAGVPTFILSNTSELHARHVREAYPFFSSFDGYVLSYLERSYKPEEGIYRAAERATGLTGPELCFIDDKEENVEGARALGWSVIHHTHVGQSLRAMAKLGLPVIDHP